MEVKTGKSILNGIAIGKIKFYNKNSVVITDVTVDDPEAEFSRFESAVETAVEQLYGLKEKAEKEVGEENAQIFEVHAMMLQDDDFTESVEEFIKTHKRNAEYAVHQTGENLAEMFASMDDEYMKARSADMRDISSRVVNILSGADLSSADSDEPFILVAEDLAPSETVQLDKSKLLGFVTRLGSTNSHTAILARTMVIPALIGVEINPDWDGHLAIIDGYNACIYIDPSDDIYASLKAKQDEDLRQRALLQDLKKKPNVTLDGTEIKVYCNIGNASDVGLVLQNDAQGIGLFRSEFIYLNSKDYPTEEEQFKIYRQVAENMAGKKVIIRTLDIGADKQADYFKLDKEENPALGFRAIRICLTRKDIFKTQLRAILRASAYGTISIMFPMIISLRELREAKKILAECKQELINEGVTLGEVEIGIMIETPAAVLCADDLAEEVQFFSIGTNDLTQYTLAIDRQNPKLDPFYNAHHPAVLRSIQMTIDAGHRHGCWVGICGELGADQALTEIFLRMGIDELSVAPGAVLPLRKIIRELDLSE
ncbi:MAG: phosphoenolpyruvate--protein phosphotransferase [Blautia sp.]|nr:phosphoenolpyruvate--protein phosphotransferase [Blautia sp.]